MNNPVWLMSSAWPDKNLEDLMDRAETAGAQGLELCVFRRDGKRKDHVATHLDYENFDCKQARNTLNMFNDRKLSFSMGAYENLIGGDEQERILNQNHLLKLIRMASMLGGNDNGITVGTFTGYNHQWDCRESSFEQNLLSYAEIFTPIIKYAEDLNVTVLYENCPMEGWRSAAYSQTMNNLPSTLAARKLMYALIPSRAHGEIYDPSHDIWQYVNPLDVLKNSDISRIKTIHLKTSRMLTNASSIHWGGVFGKQKISAALAEKADVPLPVHDWDRFAYEAMVPGFGGSDSMDWRAFMDYLMHMNFQGNFSIENEAFNSKGTGSDQAVAQGFRACLYHVMPMIWPLSESEGYSYDTSKWKEMTKPETGNLPLVTMKDLTD